MTTLMKASNQWATRPDDQRFTSLTEMGDYARRIRNTSYGKVLSNRSLRVVPVEGDHRGLAVEGPNGRAVLPTNWSFNQLAQQAGAPANYLRSLPAPLAADALNWGLLNEDIKDVGVLLHRPEPEAQAVMSALTGPNYGRVWNSEVIDGLIKRFGDGVTGNFRVPGEFGKAVVVDKQNTTLYASDRDMFVFLADEANRIEVPNRRNGEAGSMARGFFVWNSEVGAQTFGVATFLFDYVCTNRIVWGAAEYKEIRLRHTSSAPHRLIEEVQPAIRSYAESSTRSITDALAKARAKKIGDDQDAVNEFLAKRFGSKAQAVAIQAAHMADEGRPIETIWDATTGATALARSIPHQDKRVELERKGGALLDLVA